MRSRIRFKDIVTGSKAKTPGYGITAGFYLSVLTSQASMPSIIEIVHPKGLNGAVSGFGVPLGAGSTKEDIQKPMARGAYAIASPDQKTVLKTIVVCKEEAGYDPEPFLASPAGQLLDPETYNRIRSTWMLVQLTFESFDPGVVKAVKFLLQVADRFAELTQGVVADPISQVYKLPGSVLTPTDSKIFAARDVIQAKTKMESEGIHVFTLGMQKFGLPEVEMTIQNQDNMELATEFLVGVCQSVLGGRASASRRRWT